ncbi:Ham1-like protein [Penicillium taxi]|uniref:Ham1-like protein n=1 Tax=Penicillium taxi TaxID=168475 RepID=UPI0025453A16|nr:Ham1-like protein [Penicillium taxi]KAJ5888889.1 Ham1-like protein [Penicillium taxi]
MESVGHDGLNKMLDGFEDRTAEAVCTFAFCRGPGVEPILFQGRTVVSNLAKMRVSLRIFASNLIFRERLCSHEARPTSVRKPSYFQR